MDIERSDLKFDQDGLIPTIVQDARTHQVLMLAYMNEESLNRTLKAKQTWFWSRSRSQLWHKGETSGNTQRLLDVLLDCDHDSLVLMVEPDGPACHTQAWSCFQHRIADYEAGESPKESPELGMVLLKLYDVIRWRLRQKPEGSYTTYLFKEGLDKILKKIGEETAELIIAAKNRDGAATCAEVSDLIYHLMVLLVEQNVSLDQIRDELYRRQQGRLE